MDWSVGRRWGSFVVTRSEPILELNSTLIELRHEKSGALVMHLANEDEENLFCLSFQTFPYSSNGIAHILEHTVLCGSKKFPVKDPFFAMTRRSLNTFMNAMTGRDFTCYPAASQVERDFYNLLEVYLDAVFYPELKKLSFLQEGWRIEFSEENDVKSPIVYKGVVYNEIKGSMNSSDSRLYQAMMKHLFPDSPYGYNSGGDPKYITELSYEELVEFHRDCYHPSRCLFFFYGNLPLEKHLDFIEKMALNGVGKRELVSKKKYQKRFLKSIDVVERYPIHESESRENKDIIAFGFLTCHIDNQEEALALLLLDSLLMDTDASPLKRALLKTKLCSSVESFMDQDIGEIPWFIVCKGCEEKNKERLFLLFQESLKSLKISKKLVDASLHQLELSRTEIGGEQYPFGLLLFFRSGLMKQHGCDPKNGLAIHALFDTLLKNVKDPSYLQNLVSKYLINNNHCVKMVLKPDPALEKEEAVEEREKLDKLQKTLNGDLILKETKALKEFQKGLENQSLSSLPKLKIEEIPKVLKDYPLVMEKRDNLNIFHHGCFTNKIVYVDLVFDLPKVDDLALLFLFSSLLFEVGNKKRNYKKNLEYIYAHTGGMEVSLSTHTQVLNKEVCKPAISLRGKALYRKAGKLFELLMDTLTSFDFEDKERVKELIRELNTNLEISLNRNAMRYAIDLSIQDLHPSSFIKSYFGGFNYFQRIKEIAKDLDKNLDFIIESLKMIGNRVLCLENASLVIGCCDEFYHKLKKNEFYGLMKVPFKPFEKWNVDIELKRAGSHGRAIASPVAFTSMAMNTVGYLDEDAPSLLAATYLLENKFLHPLIREQGGAYGARANYAPLNGNFNLYAYRDPHLASTIDAFKLAVREIANHKFNLEDLEEAKLGVLQSLDAPIYPGHRAISAYDFERDGETYAIRSEFRKRILGLTEDMVVKAVRNNILPKVDEAVVVSFALESLLKDSSLRVLPI